MIPTLPSPIYTNGDFLQTKKKKEKKIHLKYEAKKSTVLQHLGKIALYDSSVLGTIIYRLTKEA